MLKPSAILAGLPSLIFLVGWSRIGFLNLTFSIFPFFCFFSLRGSAAPVAFRVNVKPIISCRFCLCWNVTCVNLSLFRPRRVWFMETYICTGDAKREMKKKYLAKIITKVASLALRSEMRLAESCCVAGRRVSCIGLSIAPVLVTKGHLHPSVRRRVVPLAAAGLPWSCCPHHCSSQVMAQSMSGCS